MTEAEWLACTGPDPMLEWLRDAGRASDRNVRLFAAACCRRVLGLLTAPSASAWLAVCEDSTGGEAAHQAWERAVADVREAEYQAWCCGFVPNPEGQRVWGVDRPVILMIEEALHGEAVTELGVEAVLHASGTLGTPRGEEVEGGERAAQSRLLRCIFGNPFRPVALAPAWLTPDVVSLAQAAYDNRTLPAGTLEPERLSLLADALEDAGCDNADLLAHLRAPGPHVRGCWPLDLLLGKE
jgi:hypothetical protein